MKTFEELKAFYMSIGETEKAATRHAKSAMALQNSEGLMHAYAEGSKIKQRESRKGYNNLH